MLELLKQILADLYPTRADARTIVAALGLDDSHVSFSDQAANTWNSIVTEANHRGKLQKLVAIAKSRFPEHVGLARVNGYLEFSETFQLTKEYRPGRVMEDARDSFRVLENKVLTLEVQFREHIKSTDARFRVIQEDVHQIRQDVNSIRFYVIGAAFAIIATVVALAVLTG